MFETEKIEKDEKMTLEDNFLDQDQSAVSRAIHLFENVNQNLSTPSGSISDLEDYVMKNMPKPNWKPSDNRVWPY